MRPPDRGSRVEGMLRVYLLSILGGIALAPLGAVVGTIVTYYGLALRGMAEDQGRRGLLAGLIGGGGGLVLGFYAGFQVAWWIIDGDGGNTHPWAGAILSALFGLLGATLLGVPGLYFGVLLAEHQGVTNYMGERAAWALFWVAIPLAALGGLAGFLLGWWLA